MIRTDLGPLTAYAYARQQGYGGTEEEFATEIGQSAANAQLAAESAQIALNSAQTATNVAKNEISNALDTTLSVRGKIADAGAVGELNKRKIDKPIGANGKPTDGTNGQILRTKGNGETEWTNVGLPTDAQTKSAINAWLDNHPEATSTVQDESLTDGKFTNSLRLKTLKDYLTPEMFGAVGDGVTDDTEAIQAAFDDGAKAIMFSKNAYKCGRIVVNHDCYIDCNNATFLCTENVLFDCTGSVLKSYIGNDYASWEKGYLLDQEDPHTGLVMLKGINNAFHARTYYYGGFVGKAIKGVLQESYPVEATYVTVEEIEAIKVHICNISDVVFENVDFSNVIRFYRNEGSIAENVNQTSPCYSVVSIENSLSCMAKNCNITCEEYSGSVEYNYPIEIIDSSYCSVEDCTIVNLVWHCITTGGNYLCYKNSIRNCKLYSENGSPAYHDHDNGIGTNIYNSEISSITVGALCAVRDTHILPCGGTYNSSLIRLQATDDKNIANYSVENCTIIGADNTNGNYFGIAPYVSPQVNDSYTYHVNKINIDGVNCIGTTESLARLKPLWGYGELSIDSIDIKNSNLTVQASANVVRFESLTKSLVNQKYPAIGVSGGTINLIIGLNSGFNSFGGTANVYLTNCASDGTALNNDNAILNAVNSLVYLAAAYMRAGKVYARNCTLNGGTERLDIVGINNVGYYGRYSSSGYAVTQI